jgi:hypothetical protein
MTERPRVNDSSSRAWTDLLLLGQSLSLLTASRSPIYRGSLAFIIDERFDMLLFRSLGFIEFRRI